MNHVSKYLSPVFVSIALIAVTGCASMAQHEVTDEYVDDSVVTTNVKAAVFNEATLKSSDIDVETFKGVVQLSGFINSQADINKAVELARGVTGVTSVNNDMWVTGHQ